MIPAGRGKQGRESFSLTQLALNVIITGSRCWRRISATPYVHSLPGERPPWVLGCPRSNLL